MSGTVTEAIAAELPREIEIDPYAYQPGVGTRIAGLVEGEFGNDPGYVFHTSYFEVGRGIASFTARFAGLFAKEGTLQLRVHMLIPGETPRLALANSERILLSRLAKDNGHISLKFEAFRDARYAFYAGVIGKTDARAEALSITLERPAPEARHKDENTEARNSSYGQDTGQDTAHLISAASPTLKHPVTQVATEAQLREGGGTRGAMSLGRAIRDKSLERWAALYTLQALSSYGVLTRGARGLAFGAASGQLAAEVASKTAEIVVALEPDAPAIDLSAPNIISCVATYDSLGTTLGNFDFFWTSDIDGTHGSATGWIARVEEAISCILPGGLAVFTFGYDPQVSMRRSQEQGEVVRVGRAEVEQLALILISRGHQVAQLRLVGNYMPFTVDAPRRHSAAGLIVRRAALAG